MNEKKPRTPRESLIRNTIICAGLLTAATLVSTVISHISNNATNVTMVYILCVLMVARYTDGYVPGIIASVVSTFFINLVFTYPYMEFNFTLEGYPFTFACTLTIATITSAMTSRMKEQSAILSEREKLLMEAEKEKMRANLLRAVSHDLRTPLTGIIGTSSTYLENGDGLSETEKKNLIRNIYEDSNWLLNMVENLLSVTRIRDGNTQVAKTPEPLEEVIASAVQRFKKRVPDATVTVQAPEEFVMLPMDATLIEQVILNLLENAYCHGNPQKPIRLIAYLQAGQAWVQVADQGPGIPADRIPTIFDGSIYTAGSSDSRKGMGIGLSICKSIISAHNGTIQASNLPGGACFTFSLPLGEPTNESETDHPDH